MRAFLTPDTPGGDTVRRVLVIPVEFLSSVNGALEILAEAENWEQYGTMTPQEAADEMRAVIDDYYAGGVVVGPTQIAGSFSPMLALSGSSSANLAAAGSQIHNAYWAMGSGTINAKWLFKFAGLAGDTFSLSMVVVTYNGSGILKCKVDGITIGTFDLYSASSTNNVKVIFGPTTLATDGYHDLELIVDAKNASSSAYNARISELFYRINPA